MRGVADNADGNIGSLDVVDLRWRANRLLLSMELQALSNDERFLVALKQLPTGIAVLSLIHI